jgi:hypothetical protein
MADEDPIDIDSEVSDVETDGSAPLPGEGSNRTFIIIAAAMGGFFVLGIICIVLYLVFVQGPQRAAQQAQIDAIKTQNAQTEAQYTAVFLTEQAAGSEPTATPENLGNGTATPELGVTDTPAAPAATDTPVVAVPTDTPVVAGNTPTPESGGETPTPGGGGQASATPEANLTQIAGGPTATPGPGGSVTPTPGGGNTTPTKLPSRTPTGGVPVTTTGTPGTQVSGVGGTATPRAGATPGATATPVGVLPNTGFADDFGIPSLIIAALALVVVVIIARRLRLSLR